VHFMYIKNVPVSKYIMDLTICLYVQKVTKDKDTYINGFYKDNNMPWNEYHSRTKVNKMDLSMEMRNVSVSDEGQYKCIIFVSGAEKRKISMIILKVTAEYSVPTITTNCTRGCSAVGGYPQSFIRWAGLNPSLTSIVYNESSADNESKTWTVNQTIVYNCDQPTNISCAIGGAVSDTITICECVVGCYSITDSDVVLHTMMIYTGHISKKYKKKYDTVNSTLYGLFHNYIHVTVFCY
uniref:Ig-like domain-containing protein n=1 Tax=Cyprinus carpio TaxID=7962 RepID=A0A8C2JZI3_CYPCA